MIILKKNDILKISKGEFNINKDELIKLREKLLDKKKYIARDLNSEVLAPISQKEILSSLLEISDAVNFFEKLFQFYVEFSVDKNIQFDEIKESIINGIHIDNKISIDFTKEKQHTY